MGEGPSDANDNTASYVKGINYRFPLKKKNKVFRSGQTKSQEETDSRPSVQNTGQTRAATATCPPRPKGTPTSKKNTAPSPPPPNAVPRHRKSRQKNHPKQSPLATPQTPATTQQLDSLKLKAGASDCDSGTVEAGNGSGAPYLETQTTE